MKRILLILTALMLSGWNTGTAQETVDESDDWFVFSPTNTTEDGVIGMTGWLDAPAGKHGFVQISGSGFAFGDGTPIKFWGTNHSNRGCGPNRDEADRRAAWFAKMGVNAIRLHKFSYTNGGFGDPSYSSRLTDEGWERLDYYMARLKETGIYYGWSPIYGHRLVEGDRDRVLAYEEIRENRNGNTAYLVNFAPDLQDLLIELMVNMLNHRNPHTGLRYADDPGLAFVELQNEDNLFFAAAVGIIEQAPTYKKMFCRQFSDWLREKYGSHEDLVKAWGGDGIDMFPQYMTGEHLAKNNIYPIAHHGYYSQDAIAESASPQRLLDTARFIYETQTAFYDRYVAAIRETGYEGPIVGSCWQAGSGVSHYYNLHADYRVGIIDRHNYFAARPHSLQPGPFPNNTMISHAGSGLLSSGLQAVKGRPFVLSEWTSKMPNEWIVEGPAIIGVYGMGFQGWDGSYHFNAGISGFSDEMEAPNVYNTNNLAQIGLFPALARMIARNDVREGGLLPNRNVHVPSLIDGFIGFEESIRQQADVKELGGDVPVDALALGRLEVEFTDKYVPTELPDFSGLVSSQVARANTGQLLWDYSGEGYFTVDTPGTKAVVGHAAGRTFRLGAAAITVNTPFAAVFVTSLDREKSISEASSILVTTLARARNSGMQFDFTGGDAVLGEVGGPPLLVEPVDVAITMHRLGDATMHVLDHDGIRTGMTVPRDGDTFTIDGSEYTAVWYEIRYE